MFLHKVTRSCKVVGSRLTFQHSVHARSTAFAVMPENEVRIHVIRSTCRNGTTLSFPCNPLSHNSSTKCEPSALHLSSYAYTVMSFAPYETPPFHLKQRCRQYWNNPIRIIRWKALLLSKTCGWPE